MKPAEIEKDRSYLNKSGRAERRVLDIGAHVAVRWLGDDASEPVGEAGVRYVDVRLGKTAYAKNGELAERTMYLSSFADWSKSSVPDGRETPWKHSPAAASPEAQGIRARC